MVGPSAVRVKCLLLNNGILLILYGINFSQVLERSYLLYILIHTYSFVSRDHIYHLWPRYQF